MMDPDYQNFIGFPTNNFDTASQWANVIDSYAKLIIPVITSSNPAKNAFKAQMLPVSSNVNNGLIQLTLAFSSYATALSLAMQPIFTGTPPPTPINFAPVFVLGLSGASGEQTANVMANIIHLWFKTGIAVNNSSGATVPWN